MLNGINTCTYSILYGIFSVYLTLPTYLCGCTQSRGVGARRSVVLFANENDMAAAETQNETLFPSPRCVRAHIFLSSTITVNYFVVLE